MRAAGGYWSLPTDGFLTPHTLSWENQRFETAGVYVQINAAGRFKVSGLGNRPVDLSLSDLRPFVSFSPLTLAESVSAPADLALTLNAALLELNFDFGGEAPADGEVEGIVVAEDNNGATVHEWIDPGERVRTAAPLGEKVELTAHFDGFAPTTVPASRHRHARAATNTDYAPVDHAFAVESDTATRVDIALVAGNE